MNWYYADAGKQAGPVDDAHLEALVSSGVIQPETLVWHEGMANWQPYREARMVAGAAPSPADSAATTEAVCVECTRIFDKNSMIKLGDSYVCAACKPIFMQKLSEGGKTSNVLRYAGFWIRFGAKMVDSIILVVVIVLPLCVLLALFAATTIQPQALRGSQAEPPIGIMLVYLLFYPVAFAGVVAYYTFFVGKYGASPGKMVCGLRVVDATGANVRYGRAFGRACAEILSGMVCNIGYIIAAFDDQKRALHDHICSTRVIYK